MRRRRPVVRALAALGAAGAPGSGGWRTLGARRLTALLPSLALVAAAAVALPGQAGPVLLRGRAQPPRVDGFRLGVAGISQQVALTDGTGWDRGTGLGIATAGSWALHPRLAMLAAYGRAPATIAGRDFRVTQLDALLHYQVSRGWKAYPYLEAGVTRRRVAEAEGSGFSYEGWLATVGAGLRYAVRDELAIVGGVRVTRGLLDDTKLDGESIPAPALPSGGSRVLLGAEWRARAGRVPRTPFVLMRPPRPQGLGLIAAANYLEYGDGATQAGAGRTYGLSWGLGDHLAVALRDSKGTLRAGGSEQELRHRDLVARYTLRGLVTGLRPYAEAGASEVRRQYQLTGTDFREATTLPVVGFGVLYAIRDDLDADVGLEITSGRVAGGPASTASTHHSYRLRAGLEYRPAR